MTDAFNLNDDAASLLERGTVTIDVLANDLGEGLQIIGYSAASGATITQDAQHNLVYTADAEQFFVLTPGQTTQDVITYRVQDSTGAIAEAKVAVTVGGAPNAPDIHADNHKNVIVGTDGDERIWTGPGGDIVLAGYGSDTVTGGPGRDHLYGEDGPDRLIGGAGGDWLWGGYGDDTMTGGQGPDVFGFDDFWGHDVITDFDVKNDAIELPLVYYTSRAEVLKDATSDGHGNLVITTPGHDGHLHTITLIGVSASSLRDSNFVFI